MCCVFVQYVLRICVCVCAHVVYVCTPLPSLLCLLLRPSHRISGVFLGVTRFCRSCWLFRPICFIHLRCHIHKHRPSTWMIILVEGQAKSEQTACQDIPQTKKSQRHSNTNPKGEQEACQGEKRTHSEMLSRSYSTHFCAVSKNEPKPWYD